MIKPGRSNNRLISAQHTKRVLPQKFHLFVQSIEFKTLGPNRVVQTRFESIGVPARPGL